MALLTQVRDGLFAKVAMHAVRQLALRTFEHMHRLSLRFHLERKTGGLTRVLERGRNGIEELTRLFVLQLIPTIVELVLVIGILAYEFTWLYSAVVVGMVILYLAYTYKATEWRIAIRKQMNDSDTDASTKAVDSLLNFETVKYFGAEMRETERYDRSMARYEKASTQTYTSLAVLNSGQAVIYTIGMTIIMALAARDIMRGTGDDRQLRARQRHADPALHPAQLHGHALSRDQAGADRHRRHVPHPRAEPGDPGPARREAPRRERGRACASRTCISPTCPSARSSRA